MGNGGQLNPLPCPFLLHAEDYHWLFFSKKYLAKSNGKKTEFQSAVLNLNVNWKNFSLLKKGIFKNLRNIGLAYGYRTEKVNTDERTEQVKADLELFQWAEHKMASA
jgi:hypothetical protein